MAVGTVLEIKNAQGAVVSELDVGWNARVALDLTSLWDGISAVTGTITLGSKQVATLGYNTTTKKVVVNWAQGNVLTVANGDVLKVTISTPISYTRSYVVRRIQPTWEARTDLAYIVRTLRDAGLQGKTLYALLNDGIDRINANYAAPVFTYSPNLALNIKRIRAFLANDPNLTLIV